MNQKEYEQGVDRLFAPRLKQLETTSSRPIPPFGPQREGDAQRLKQLETTYQAQVHARQHDYHGNLGDLEYFEVGKLRKTKKEAEADLEEWENEQFGYTIDRTFIAEVTSE
jgi:hypothetical protein